MEVERAADVAAAVGALSAPFLALTMQAVAAGHDPIVVHKALTELVGRSAALLADPHL